MFRVYTKHCCIFVKASCINNVVFLWKNLKETILNAPFTSNW